MQTTAPLSVPLASARQRWAALARLQSSTVTLGLAFGLLALLLRLLEIGRRGLWGDEIYSVRLAAQPVAQIVRAVDFHPPLHALILHFWAHLGGFAFTDAGARVPSALASAAAVGLAAWLV